MSELQTDESTEIEDDVITDEEVDEGREEQAPLASAESGETEKNTDDEDGAISEQAQKVINRKHWEAKEEERKRIAAEKELEELRQKMAESSKQSDEIVIPPMPDAWDADYDEKVRARDEAIHRKAVAEAEKQKAEDEAYRKEQEQQVAAQKAWNEKLDTYVERAQKHGINENDLAVASKRIADAGVSPEVANYLISAEDGPLVTAYLADERNTMELLELVNADPINAGIKLTAIRAKAAEFSNPGTRSAPPPADVIDGGGGKVETVSPFIKGAKFE